MTDRGIGRERRCRQGVTGDAPEPQLDAHPPLRPGRPRPGILRPYGPFVKDQGRSVCCRIVFRRPFAVTHTSTRSRLETL